MKRITLGATVLLAGSLAPRLAQADESPPASRPTQGDTGPAATPLPPPAQGFPPPPALPPPAFVPPPPSRPIVEATPTGLKLPGGIEVAWYGTVKPTVVVGTGVESFGAQNHVATTAAQNPIFASPAGSPDGAAFSFQVAQSRFGLTAGTKTVGARIELDFVQFQLAAPVQAGFPRVRQAYVFYEPTGGHQVSLGQMWDTFSPLNSHTFDLVGGLFQAGNTGFMRDQLAYRVDLGRLELSGAVGMPAQNATTQLSAVEYGLVPTFALRAAYKKKGALYAGVSGIVTEVGVTNDLSRTAGGVNGFVDATLGPMNLRAEVVAGQNLNNLGLLSLSQGTADGNVAEVGGWLSSKVNVGDVHALHVLGGVAAVTNPSGMRVGYTPATTAEGKTTAASRVAANGPGIERNVSIRAGYSFSPAMGLSFVVEPYVFLTKHKLALADADLYTNRRAFGVQAGAMYTF